jgi:hypothetical protein
MNHLQVDEMVADDKHMPAHVSRQVTPIAANLRQIRLAGWRSYFGQASAMARWNVRHSNFTPMGKSASLATSITLWR